MEDDGNVFVAAVDFANSGLERGNLNHVPGLIPLARIIDLLVASVSRSRLATVTGLASLSACA